MLVENWSGFSLPHRFSGDLPSTILANTKFTRFDSKASDTVTVMNEDSKSFEYGSIDNDEFLLSAYGFAEPSEIASRKKFPFAACLVVLGVALLSTAIFLKSRSS